MQPDLLRAAERELRTAIAYQEYGEVVSRIDAYCEAARSHLETLSSQDSRHRVCLARVLDVLEWTRLMICTARATCGDRLERVDLLDRYLQSQGTVAPPDTLALL